jgi:hypothetical protein
MNPWAGWSKEKPTIRERKTQKKHCFLGTKRSYPICTKGTNKVNQKGIWAAYVRARQYKNKTVAQKAKKMISLQN